MLEIDGNYIVQSHSILRYVANKYGWYDAYDAATVALIDMAGDGTEDIRFRIYPQIDK
jgi:glutathione S-transferase